MRSLAVVVFAAVGCYSVINLLIGAEGSKACFSDISAIENEYRALKSELPGRGTVGYEAGGAGSKEYFVAEYALCPLVLDRDGPHEYNVRVDEGRASVVKNEGAAR